MLLLAIFLVLFFTVVPLFFTTFFRSLRTMAHRSGVRTMQEQRCLHGPVPPHLLVLREPIHNPRVLEVERPRYLGGHERLDGGLSARALR